MTPNSSAERKLLDHDERLRNLEINQASIQRTLEFILQGLKEQVEINRDFTKTRSDMLDALKKNRSTVWGYIIGAIGAIIIVVEVVLRMKTGG